MASNSDSRPHTARRSDASGTPNLSLVIAVDDVPESGLQIPVRAGESERVGIAKRADLIGVQKLEADLEIAKHDETKFRVVGRLRARIVQTCVVSLEPFESEIEAEIDADFSAQVRTSLPQRGRGARGRESPDDLSPSFAAQLDAPDPIVDGRIDLGALVEEFLVLNLDPYPRKPGISFETAEFSSAPDEKASPFAVLKKLRDGD